MRDPFSFEAEPFEFDSEFDEFEESQFSKPCQCNHHSRAEAEMFDEYEEEQPDTYSEFGEEYESDFEGEPFEIYPEYGELGELVEEGEGSGPGAGCGLTGVALNNAVRDNRTLARRLGWGCIVAGRANPIPEVLALLGLGASPTEEDLACAIARWQQTVLRQRGVGRLDPSTWAQMLRRNVIPASAFKRLSLPVFFGGRQLGVLEKTRPYRKCFFDPVPGAACRPNRSGVAGEGGGSGIELGFRVTDIGAVQRSGFVDATGEDNFHWIQVITTNRRLEGDPVRLIRRHGRVIDPNSGPLDPHPYYWDEVTPPGGDAQFHISNFLNRQANNRLCYDLIFEDVPRRSLSEAHLGRRVYWNAELALVGVRPGRRNVILNTVLWGFDLVIEREVRNVRLNALGAGRRGGSPSFRQALSRAIQAGNFPGHCFVGSDFIRAVRCS